MEHDGCQNRASLKKVVSPKSVWAISLGAIVGSGCFIMPGELLKEAGPAGVALGLIIGAFTMLIIGRNVCFLVEHYPVAGGTFAFTFATCKPYHAYICGWMISLGFVGCIALNASALSIVAKFIFPEAIGWGYLYSVAGWEVYLPEIVLSSAVVLLFGYLNYKGNKFAAHLRFLMVLCLLAAVFVIAIGTFFCDQSSADHLLPFFAPAKGIWGSIAAIVAMSPWIFTGFETIPQSAEEHNFSPRKAKLLMGGSVLVGAIVFIIMVLATAFPQPWLNTIEKGYLWPTGTITRFALGNAGMTFLAVAISMGIFTCINGLYIASSRLLLSMGRAGMLPACFAKVDPRYHTPGMATLLVMLTVLAAPWFGRQVIVWIVDMCAVGTSIGYLYACISAYRISNRKNTCKKDRAFSVAGILLASIFLVLLFIPESPGAIGRESTIALIIWIALGAIFYAASFKRMRRIPQAERMKEVFGFWLEET